TVVINENSLPMAACQLPDTSLAAGTVPGLSAQFVDTIQRSARLWSLTGDQVFLPSKAPFFAPIPLNYSNLRSHPLACKGEGVLEGGTPPRAVRNYFDRLCRTAWCCKAKLNHSELAPL